MEKQLAVEVKAHLLQKIIPFWRNLRDEENGGYYGWFSYELQLDKKSVKGCILNSRITWFFANAYTLYKTGKITETECQAAGFSGDDLLEEAKHGYDFLKKFCLDKENGGIFWSLNYDGTPEDTTKHTYNQAFSIYALASYYEASKDVEALKLAFDLFRLIEERCRDGVGYLEAFTIDFKPESNEKLSENGVMADKTMNTLLHVFEAYTELLRVSEAALTESQELAVLQQADMVKVKQRLIWMLDIMAEKIYNPKLCRQEVFFDAEYNSILDLHSYGHDIETAWLVDKGVEVLNDTAYAKKMFPITQELTAQIYKIAFDGHSLANECEKGVVNENRIWWVQAEAMVGFYNGYQKNHQKNEYLEAALNIWEFIKEYVVDKRQGSEWFWEVNPDGTPIVGRPIVEPWKCPYHNGRMCMEIIKRV